ncbi:hypothetical protein L484_014119 [Morus notabilis]|uniref:Uncharacterized protein n=1 Tax=Morus notabilis TaxID=981085 RepID=W9RZL2_9ROSA|nr:hypothetical protein L484_014119 [Morus notabilis]
MRRKPHFPYPQSISLEAFFQRLATRRALRRSAYDRSVHAWQRIGQYSFSNFSILMHSEGGKVVWTQHHLVDSPWKMLLCLYGPEESMG